MKKQFLHRTLSCFLSLILFLSLLQTGFIVQAQESNGQVNIDVTDYGADSSGIGDSTVAVQKALAAAQKATAEGAQSVIIDFPKGEYSFYQDFAEKREYHTSNTNSIENPVKNIGILIENQSNLTLQGNGSMFLMHGNLMALAVVKSNNVRLQNFSWDFGAATNSEMTVLEKGTTSDGKPYTDYFIPSNCPYIIKGNDIRWVSEQSPYTGEYYWEQVNTHDGWTSVGYNANTKILKRYGPNQTPFGYSRTVSQTSENVVRFTYSDNAPANEEVGFTWEYCNTPMRKTAGAFIWESKDTYVENVNVHFLNQFGWLNQMIENITFKNCNFMPRQETGRICTSYADLIHVSGAKGKVIVEDCNFSQALDDPINIHGTFTRVENKTADNQLILRYVENQQGGFPQYHIGDQVVFAARDSLLPPGLVEEIYTVTEVVNPFEDGDTTGKYMTVTFDKKLPASITDQLGAGQPKYVAENISYTPQVEIRNNDFATIPTRGILCTTRNKVLIEENVFRDMAMQSIFVSNDSNAWYESGPVKDMTIRNNTFYLTNAQMGGESQSLIHFHPEVYGNTLDVDNPVHQNILIEGNTFYMENVAVGNIVQAESVKNLTIRNNTVINRNPEIALNASVQKATLALDESTDMKIEAVEQKVQQPVFSFTKCNTVNVSGNTFSNGMNLKYINNNSKNLNIQNDIAAGTDQYKSALGEGKIKYVSDNPAVVSVDSSGSILAASEGKANVFAFVESDGVNYRSNKVQIEVTAGTPVNDSIQITAADNQMIKSSTDTLTFATDAKDPVIWSVKNPLMDEATDAAVISETGVLTPVRNGIVKVQANLGEASDSRIVIISMPVIQKELNESYEFIQEVPDYWTTAGSTNAVGLKMQEGDLYGLGNAGGAGVKNLLSYHIPSGVDKDDLWAMIDIAGLPNRSEQSLTASFMLYKDNDNYVSIGKKGHMNGITTVNEVAGATVEMSGDAAHNDVVKASFAIHKSGNSIDTYFKEPGGNWVKTQSNVQNANLGTDYRIAMAAWAPAGFNDLVTFENLRVASGLNDVSELEQVPAAAIFNMSEKRPQLTEGTLDKSSVLKGETVTASYQYNGEVAAEQIIYGWKIKDMNNHIHTKFTTTSAYAPNKAGQLSCTIYAADKNGAYAEPITSSQITVTENTNTEEPPAEILDTTTSLQGIEIPELSVNGDASNFKFTDRNGLTAVTLKLTGTETVSKIEVKRGSYMIPLENTMGAGAVFEGTMPIYPGTNTAYVVVTAENGVTQKEYRLNISSVGQTDAGISNISIDETPLEGFQSDVYRYDYFANKVIQSIRFQMESTNPENELITSYEGGSVSGTEAIVPLKKGINTITVGSIAKDGIKKKLYYVKVFVPDDSNSSLISMALNNSPLADFKTDKLEYKAAVSGTEMKIDLKAQEEKATIDIKYANTKKSATGKFNSSIPIFNGDYDMQITVTSPDKKTKTVYMVHVSCSGKMYLSDLELNETSFFEKNLRKDFSISENTPTNKIRLINESGNAVVYEKGVGVQAPNQFECNIEGKGYKTLSGLTGIDYVQYGNNNNDHNESSASVTFQIFLDDSSVPVFDSGIMYHDTPGKEFIIDVQGAKKIRFQTLEGVNPWYDHGDWANVKFTTEVTDFTPSDKTALSAAVKKGTAPLSQTSVYTKESLDKLKLAVDKASVLVNDKFATAEDITAAIKDIDTAIAGLVKQTVKPPVNPPVNPPVQPPAKIKVTSATISAISDLKHSGKALKPSPKIKGYTLGTDYTLSYQNNVNPGTAKITIQFTGKYTGTLYKNFRIVAAKGKTYKYGASYFKISNASVKSGTAILTRPIKSTNKSITVPDYIKIGNIKYKVTEIGAKAFRKNTKLQTVKIGKYVTKIGNDAFLSCKALKKISLPSSVTSTGSSSFKDCVSMTEFKASGLVQIGSNCFYGNKKLKSISISSKKLKKVGTKAFYGIYSKAKIKVPSSKLKSYQKLMKGKGQKNTVKIAK